MYLNAALGVPVDDKGFNLLNWIVNPLKNTSEYLIKHMSPWELFDVLVPLQLQRWISSNTREFWIS